MMKRATQILALAACLVSASAQACEQYHIDTIPLAVTIDQSRSYADLTKSTNGAPTFSYLKARYSASLWGCTIQAGYADPVIYIGSEFAGNPCTRNELLAHELRHLHAYAVALSTFETRLRAALLTRPLEQALEDTITDVERAHSAIDSQAEYTRMLQACSGAIAATTGLKP